AGSRAEPPVTSPPAAEEPVPDRPVPTSRPAKCGTSRWARCRTRCRPAVVATSQLLPNPGQTSCRRAAPVATVRREHPTSCRGLRELPLQYFAQHLRHGHAAVEGRQLDPRTQCWRDVQCQAGAIALDLAVIDSSAFAYPGFGLRVAQWACTDTDALAAHGDHLSNSSTRLLTSRAAALSGASSRARRPAATLSAKTMRCRTFACSAGSGWSAKAPRASRPITVVLTQRLMANAARSVGLNTCASRIRLTISALAHRS